MGTRSLTYIEENYRPEDENNGENILCMYRQYDGYMSGHGYDLAHFLEDFKIVNGLGLRDDKIRVANGMGCLAAQLIAHFKDRPGDIYIYHPDAEDCGEEFTYTIYTKGKGGIYIRAYDVYSEKVIFDGTPEQLLNKINITENNIKINQ